MSIVVLVSSLCWCFFCLFLVPIAHSLIFGARRRHCLSSFVLYLLLMRGRVRSIFKLREESNEIEMNLQASDGSLLEVWGTNRSGEESQ